MNFDASLTIALSIIGTIVLSIFSNLLTTYFFPDGGKKALTSLFVSIGHAILILVDMGQFILLGVLFFTWVLYPSWFTVIVLGFAFSNKIVNIYWEQEKNRRRFEDLKIEMLKREAEQTMYIGKQFDFFYECLNKLLKWDKEDAEAQIVMAKTLLELQRENRNRNNLNNS